MKEYIYRGLQKGSGPKEVLPEGDYNFIVSSHGDIYEKNERWILPVKLLIGPTGHIVFANPWAGETDAGEPRDQIAEFLAAINRLPKEGTSPDWYSIDGARGRCKLRQKIAQKGALVGKPVNQVAFFYAPKQLPFQPASKGLKNELDLSREPNDIPF